MAGKSDMLREQVNELRRLYDYISSSMDKLRSKTLALLAGEVAVVSFLFTSNRTDPGREILVSLSDAVFLGTGVVLLILAFVIFLWLLQPVEWEHPPETSEMIESEKHYNGSEEKFLERLVAHYLRVIPSCNTKLGIKSKRFVLAVYFLALGIFLVAVLKYGNGGLAL